eukprot:TRINITY_DN81607_c0_g1_i1.p1 TRINITY_DN81607_c0_g1~~TRINITY_DN81607_c0_g1_i1.p1  ORF type:complete len:731 (-),score=151.15 TRINITY_DN81607_c0_g1_i1:1238-3304(-)
MHHRGGFVGFLLKERNLVLAAAKLGIPFMLFFSGSSRYNASLAGGTPEWIHDHVLELSINLFLSVLYYSVGVSILLLFPFTLQWKYRFIPLTYPILAVFSMFAKDQGNTITQHGAYNSLFFCVLFFPLFLLLIGVTLCWRYKPSKKHFFAYWVLAILFVGGFGTYRMVEGRIEWEKGIIQGTRLQPRSDLAQKCTIRVPLFCWYDLTDGWINSWTGPQSCPEETVFSIWSDDLKSTKRNDCDIGGECFLKVFKMGQESKTVLEVLPRTEKFSLQQKRLFTDYQLQVLRHAEKIEIPNESTFVLKNSSAEAFVVRKYDKSGSLVGTNIQMRVARNESVVERVKEFEGIFAQKKGAERGKAPNVVIAYFDAVSRRHFIRKFPKTVQFLNKKFGNGRSKDVGEFHEFFRYHARGIMTHPNDVAIFCGQLSSKKWPNGVVDVPTIWEKYASGGYGTVHIDNSCQDFSGKYQNKTSFIDHEFVPMFCLPEYYPIGNPHGNWVGPFSIRRRCLAGEQVHTYVFEYAQKFSKAYSDIPYWMWMAFTEGHEGTGEVIGLLDGDVERYLQSFDYENSILIMLADHGLHMGPLYAFGAEVATLENKLPFLNIFVPRWFSQKYPRISKHLQDNEQKLVGSFDLYATLEHILALANKDFKDDEYDVFSTSAVHGESLFSHLSEARCCEDIAIGPGTCRCR